MNVKTTFTQNLPMILRSRGQSVLNYLKQHSNIILWNEQGQMAYKDDVIKNSIVTDLYTWMIKLKSNSTNQIPPFVSLPFAKSTAEYYAPLEWIKSKNMLTMVKVVKESDEELMQDTPITLRKLLEKQKD